MPGKGAVWRRSVCPGEGAVSEETVYVRERGISAEAAFCKALLTKTFQNRAMNVKKVLRNERGKGGAEERAEERGFSFFDKESGRKTEFYGDILKKISLSIWEGSEKTKTRGGKTGEKAPKLYKNFTKVLPFHDSKKFFFMVNCRQDQTKGDASMKKFFRAMLVVLALVIGAVAMVGCGGEKDIMVIVRDSASGTRDAFDSLITKGDEELSEENLVATREEQSSTGAVKTMVATNKTAIGYISLGSVDDTVKVLKVNGVAPSSETVLGGSYSLWRPFVILNSKKVETTAAAADFIKFLQSKQAQEIVLEHGYVQQLDENTPDYVKPDDMTEINAGKVIIRGSTSIEPLMVGKTENGKHVAGLIETYIELTGVDPEEHFDVDCKGSGVGKEAVEKDANGNVIGLSSSKLKPADEEYATHFDIALDAVAVIVNNDNELEDVTIEQIFDIYTGAITKFSTLLPEENEAA